MKENRPKQVRDPSENAMIMNVEAVKRNMLRDLLEADSAVASSADAERLADEMYEKLRAGEDVDASVYGSEVGLFLHNEKKLRDKNIASRRERPHPKVVKGYVAKGYDLDEYIKNSPGVRAHRDRLRDLLEADSAVSSSAEAERLADEMYKKLARGENVDDRVYGSGVAQFIRDAKAAYHEGMEFSEKASEAKEKASEAAILRRIAQQIKVGPPSAEAYGLLTPEEKQARDPEHDEKMRRNYRKLVASADTVVTPKEKPSPIRRFMDWFTGKK